MSKLSTGIGGHHRGYRGASDVWLTPPEILAALGRFDLDPCSPEMRPWDTAARHYWRDGLELPWAGRVFAEHVLNVHICGACMAQDREAAMAPKVEEPLLFEVST